MNKLTDEEWEKLNDFDTSSLLRAVDQFDITRPYISDRLNWQPPQFRDDLLNLHEMAMNVVHHGSTTQLSELFEKAEELNDQIYEIQTALESVETILDNLLSAAPDSLYEEFDDEDE